MTKKCFICNTELLPKESVSQEKKDKREYSHVEHIIPNAIGGKLKSDKILCSKCGSNFGVEIDKALIVHCQNFSTFLNVNRDRGKNQNLIAEKKGGEKISISPDGKIKPVIDGKPNIKLNSEGKPEKIIARSLEELKMYKGILQKEFPEYKYTTKEADIFENEILNIPYLISLDTFKGVCKIAVEFYLNKNGSVAEIKHLLPYLTNEPDCTMRPVHLFYPSKKLKIDEGIYHYIHIKGIKKHQILFAYVTLFGVSSHFVALNWGNYNGEDIEYNYLYDLIELKEKNTESIFFDYSEANNFLAEIEADFKNGKTYVMREDMNNIFMGKVHRFEEIIETLRTDIKFKESDLDS